MGRCVNLIAVERLVVVFALFGLRYIAQNAEGLDSFEMHAFCLFCYAVEIPQSVQAVDIINHAENAFESAEESPDNQHAGQFLGTEQQI